MSTWFKSILLSVFFVQLSLLKFTIYLCIVPTYLHVKMGGGACNVYESKVVKGPVTDMVNGPIPDIK